MSDDDVQQAARDNNLESVIRQKARAGEPHLAYVERLLRQDVQQRGTLRTVEECGELSKLAQYYVLERRKGNASIDLINTLFEIGEVGLATDFYFTRTGFPQPSNRRSINATGFILTLALRERMDEAHHLVRTTCSLDLRDKRSRQAHIACELAIQRGYDTMETYLRILPELFPPEHILSATNYIVDTATKKVALYYPDESRPARSARDENIRIARLHCAQGNLYEASQIYHAQINNAFALDLHEIARYTFENFPEVAPEIPSLFNTTFEHNTLEDARQIGLLRTKNPSGLSTYIQQLEENPSPFLDELLCALAYNKMYTEVEQVSQLTTSRTKYLAIMTGLGGKEWFRRR